jgi:hypothetical protein
MLAQPKGAGPAVPALPASQDRAAIYDGDLLKLVVPIPKGGKDSSREYTSLVDYADEYTNPAEAFPDFANEGFQRGVHAYWTGAHDVFYEVELTQFRDQEAASAPSEFAQWSSGITYDPEHGSSVPIPGAENGYVWPSAKAHTKAGYLPEYQGRGLAEVGNILVDVFVESTHKVKSSTVKSLIDQQLERL